jgi:hypothetical protein
MKTFKQLVESLAEAWPGTKEYEAKFGKPKGLAGGDNEWRGNRHDVVTKDGVTRATRRIDTDGETKEPEKTVSGEEPVKRGRGRPAGSYGSYKTKPENKGKYKGVHAARKAKVKESIDIIEGLETEEEIAAYIEGLDSELFEDLQMFLESEGDEDTDAQDCLEEDIDEATGTEVRDPKTGKLISWKHVGDNRLARIVITDKSGAKHTAMSRVRDMARNAIKKETTKESVEESTQAPTTTKISESMSVDALAAFITKQNKE